MKNKALLKSVIALFILFSIVCGNTAPALALNLYDPAVVLELTGRLLAGQEVTYEEYMGASAPNLSAPVISDGSGYILIGDSRTVAVNSVCNVNKTPDNWFVIACAAQGFDYLVNTAIPVAEMLENAHPEITDWHYVINIGVNDMGNVEKYYKYISALSMVKNVCFVSLNPVYENPILTEGGYTNSRISSFNARIASIPKVKYIDTYSKLMSNGYLMVPDGLHYLEPTSTYIYSLIKAGAMG